MNLTELATMLRAWAAGYLPYMAAVELLVAHEHWLRRDAFLSAVTESAVQGMASIDWDVIGDRLDTGDGLHDTTSERGVLAIACSLAASRPIDLRDALLSLDATNVRLVARAVLTAGGVSRDSWEWAAPDGAFARFADEQDAQACAAQDGGTVLRAPRDVLDELDRLRARVVELEASKVRTEWGTRGPDGFVLTVPDGPPISAESQARRVARRDPGRQVLRREVRTGPWIEAAT